MGLAPLVEKETRRVVSVSLKGEDERQLRALSDALYQGSLSMAVRHLIAAHAGKALELVDAQEEAEPFDVDPWRKQRLSRDLVSRIAGLVYQGNIRAHAYALAGVSGRQASQWLAQGRADVTAGKSSLYADLVMGLDRAEAEMVSEQVAEARRKGDYKFVLGRFPEYAKRTVSDATVTHQFTPLGDWELLTITEARALVALLQKMSPSGDDPAVNRRDRPAAEFIPAEIIEHEPLQLEPPSHTPAADDEAQSEQRNSRDTEIDDLPNGIGTDEQAEPHADDYGAT